MFCWSCKVTRLLTDHARISNREIRLGAKQTIRINDKELVITGKENKINHFCYDHCFWSFDKNSPDFANQETVYQCLAQPLLESAFEGYNTCLFAYGQVRGKTVSCSPFWNVLNS